MQPGPPSGGVKRRQSTATSFEHKNSAHGVQPRIRLDDSTRTPGEVRLEFVDWNGVCAAWGHAAYTIGVRRLVGPVPSPGNRIGVCLCAAWGHAAYTTGVYRLVGLVPSPGDRIGVCLCAAWGHAAYTTGVYRLVGPVPSPGNRTPPTTRCTATGSMPRVFPSNWACRPCAAAYEKTVCFHSRPVGRVRHPLRRWAHYRP